VSRETLYQGDLLTHAAGEKEKSLLADNLPGSDEKLKKGAKSRKLHITRKTNPGP
jgi:hypothetical protein